MQLILFAELDRVMQAEVLHLFVILENRIFGASHAVPPMAIVDQGRIGN
jgi:hypothetical protein